jgi:hypothetical protein
LDWPTIDQIALMAPLPDGYHQEKLCRTQVPSLIDGIRQWHPDIAVGGGSCHLRDDFYAA